jgi:hypothetical protein
MTLNLSQARIVDPILSDRALGYSSPTQKWDKLAPPVMVKARAGTLITFGKEAFKLYNSKRAPGGNTQQVDVGYDDIPYKLVQSRLATKVPFETQEEAAIPGIDLRAESVDVIREVQMREQEYDAAAILTLPGNYPSGHAPTIGSTDKWDTTTAKPIKQIRDASNIIRRKIGRAPNTMFFTPDSWTAFSENINVTDKIKYTQNAFLYPDETGKMLRMNLEIGEDIWTNAAGTSADIWTQNGTCAILAYVAQPAQSGIRTNRQPSFAYTYVKMGTPMVEQGDYDKKTASWEDFVTWERQTYITMSEAGYLFKDVLT